MLARIALDCDALLEESADPVAQYHLHEELLRMLERHGVLLIPADKHLLAMRTKLSGTGLRELWAARWGALWKRRARPEAPDCLCRIGDGDGFAAGWGGRVDVALLSIARARVLGLPKDLAACKDPVTGVELARLDLFYAAEKLRQLREQAERHIVRGEHRETIWRERFLPLAENAFNITICDRYAGIRLCENPKAAGLRWFFEELNRCSTSSVHLITSAGGNGATPWPIAHAVRVMAEELAGGGVEHLTLTVVPDWIFSAASHDRHLRFDRVSLWIGRGLEIFEREEQGQDTSCQYLSKDVANEKEQNLLKKATIHKENLRRWGSKPWPLEKPILTVS